MSVRRSVFGALACALVVACGSSTPDDGPTASNERVIGGQVAKPGQFPATVYLFKSCTAAKVGPRTILTAAHCLFDPATRSPVYQAGSSLKIAHDPSKGYTEYNVVDSRVSESWTAACAKTYCGISAVTAKLNAADVGLLFVDRDIDDATEVAIDLLPVHEEDRVTLVGYGCTGGIYDPGDGTASPLRFANTEIVPADHVNHSGSFVDINYLVQIDETYSITDGPGAELSKAGLCPGDSGGPLYRERDGVLYVVGVNSNYTVLPEIEERVGLPVTNWHTRLDESSRFKIGTWLAGLGAKVAN